MRTLGRLILVIAGLCLAALIALAVTFSFNALPEPGAAETWAATQAKRWYISRAARSVPAEPVNDISSQVAGQMSYGSDCSACHGVDGRTPSNFGHSMYPRVPDLGSPAVQQWSNAELFWIIKNGIRHSGMPGFGNIHPDNTIWDLVHYVRSLPSQPKS
jgi:mono/diheme cytochrome c family protein